MGASLPARADTERPYLHLAPFESLLRPRLSSSPARACARRHGRLLVTVNLITSAGLRSATVHLCEQTPSKFPVWREEILLAELVLLGPLSGCNITMSSSMIYGNLFAVGYFNGSVAHR